MGANGGKNSGCASRTEWKTDRENESHLTLLLAMRNLLIIAESKWAPSPRCPPMTEQWRLCRCSTSDYFLYPWVISNLRSTLSKRLDITRRTPMKITEFLLEEEADDNKNLRLLSLPHPARKGFGIITTFYLSLPVSWHFSLPIRFSYRGLLRMRTSIFRPFSHADCKG